VELYLHSPVAWCSVKGKKHRGNFAFTFTLLGEEELSWISVVCLSFVRFIINSCCHGHNRQELKENLNG
jgi:hypothetical protein